MHEIIKSKVGGLFRLVIILLIFALVITGCEEKYKIEAGFGYSFGPLRIKIGARSETDTFDINNVILDLHYGVHDIGYGKKYGSDGKGAYKLDFDDTIFFGLYICDKKYASDIRNNMSILDYRTIENHYLVKEITEDEAFTEEYGYEIRERKGIIYNHSEEFAIPASFFTEDKGGIAIKIISFNPPQCEGENFYINILEVIGFDYQVIDENTVKLEYNEWIQF